MFPCVEQVILCVENSDLRVEFDIEHLACESEHADGCVHRIILFNAIDGDSDIGGRCVVSVNHQHVASPFDIDLSAWVFPGQGFCVVEFPEPLFSNDINFKGVFAFCNLPNGSVGGEGHHGQPNDEDCRKDVEEHLQFRVVRINGERANFNVVFIHVFNRLHAVAVAQHCDEHPPESENSNNDAPKHELVVKDGENSVFSRHRLPSCGWP